MSWTDDKRWSDRFIPIIKQLVGPHLLVPSPLDIDTQQAADLIVLRGRDMTIACRVRRHGYLPRFQWDITIRSKRDTGTKTELMKIREGWGDWMFYGHASEDPGALERWFLIDLHAWRGEFTRDGFAVALGYPTRYEGALKSESNHGDGTHFVAFDVRKFPASIVIASSHDIPRDEVPASTCRDKSIGLLGAFGSAPAQP